eukprot:gnl/TRDRNA2_/TRDRNA2_125693_c0_seq1.p1 gnl/TRDRNA2_/TRDRNA2_125693_c0~~gnl/TRDRNA2_/TRDRNA2_125693_c0_seq1.p1  ORF type:complete len:377 (-),score=56.98 gnl/TRDRNA2_/TRDRNA2_125693_c0_seq1:97-1170(-)
MSAKRSLKRPLSDGVAEPAAEASISWLGPPAATRVCAAKDDRSSCCIYVCGGDDRLKKLKSVDRLTLSAAVACSWAACAPTKKARFAACAGVIAGKIYICGGRGWEVPNALRSAECFDVATGMWQPLPMLLEPRQGAAAGVVAGKLYVCGGASGDGSGALASAECYDPATNSWQALPAMAEPRGRPAADTLRGVLYVCGGENSASGVLNSVEFFDPAVGTWSQAPAMALPRRAAAAACAVDRLFVCGGTAGPNKCSLCSVEYFESEATAWQQSAPMLVARSCAAAVVATGVLYVFGGKGKKDGTPSTASENGREEDAEDEEEPLDSIECFSTASGTWSSLPPMLQRRCDAVAVVLDS